MAKDLQVSIFVPTLLTVREAQRLSLAQDAAETREFNLLRDMGHKAVLPTSSMYSELTCVWPQGTKKVAECDLFMGGSGYIGCCLLS